MSCNTNYYLPIPPRAWSRVQNACSLVTDFQASNDSTIYLKYAMLNKGNILQYKKNSSQLTQKQKYSQISKGKWTNRTTTWATQSAKGYTNPNNLSLQRVGSINITLAGTQTTDPVTCPKTNTTINNTLPATNSGEFKNPETLPPPPPPTVNTGTNLPPTQDEVPTKPTVIQDLGNLVCGTYENICTGETISRPTDTLCHPTSDSDVPGTIMELCWNDGTPTWYPRQRYIMTNSANKWPVNATLLSAVKPQPPVIVSFNTVNNITTLKWKQDETPILVTQFTIYENNFPIQIVNGTTFSADITIKPNFTYKFYIIGKNADVYSDISNIVTITI
jgi:hypothetical protein